MKTAKKAALVFAAAGLAAGAASGSASADSGSNTTAANSPGLASGNSVTVPIHVATSACGNTLAVPGLLNPAFGNTCSNV